MSRCSLDISDLDMLSVRDAAEVKYVCLMREKQSTNISSGNNAFNLSFNCLLCPLSSFQVIREAESLGRYFDMEVRQEQKRLFVGWHNVEFFRSTASEARACVCNNANVLA